LALSFKPRLKNTEKKKGQHTQKTQAKETLFKQVNNRERIRTGFGDEEGKMEGKGNKVHAIINKKTARLEKRKPRQRSGNLWKRGKKNGEKMSLRVG